MKAANATFRRRSMGLPARITGLTRCAEAGVYGGRPVGDIRRKEVVIENDIAWRVNAAVDFLFGKPISVVSRAPDGKRRAEIEGIIKAVFSANGGIGFLQDMAVLGAVYRLCRLYGQAWPGNLRANLKPFFKPLIRGCA